MKKLFIIFTIFFIVIASQVRAVEYNMVFVPASEKGDENEPPTPQISQMPLKITAVRSGWVYSLIICNMLKNLFVYYI